MGRVSSGFTTTFRTFTPSYAASFGRKQWRELNSRNYLQGLLVQAGERRNAEEPVGIGGHLGPGDAVF